MNPVLNNRLCDTKPTDEGVFISPKWGYVQKTFYISAPISGRVDACGYKPGLGFFVDILSKSKKIKYCLSNFYKVFVNPNQYVGKKQTIGIMGSSGKRLGKGLVYCVYELQNDKWKSVDINKYLRSK